MLAAIQMKMQKRYKTSWGTPAPLPFGAIVENKGVLFRIFSRHASRVWLLLFDKPEDDEPAAEVEFDPRLYRSGDIWHMLVEGLKPGQLYLYRIDGPHEPEKGHRYDPEQWLLDPYAKAVTSTFDWENNPAERDQNEFLERARKDKDFYHKLKFAGFPKCVVIDDTFDWEGDRHLNYPQNEAIIYEAHVRGLTILPNAAFKNPGTFKGVSEIISHLKELGITTLELMPIQEFNEFELDRSNPETGEPLLNYWGYSTVSFFAPNAQYAGYGAPDKQVTEFKEMVKSLHDAGIEVILDVVFNHTAEGNEKGPTLSFKGIDNSIYYLLDDDKRMYKNYSGCGNTFNCNHPIVRRYIISCLRYWFLHMHVDGFRFDLASILGRDRNGKLLENPPLLESISEDPLLRNAKIIAEAWDMAGAYQVGSFPGGRWSEWNGRYRDDVRRFWKGEPHIRASFAYRITGSSDLYLRDGRKPFHSINFVTSHDGFTLNDLVSYNNKHNEINSENNRDGDDYNNSCNYGVEGETNDPEIQKIRPRQIKNFLATLMLSQGVPMLLAGDEFRRTQRGNNNAYCQDNDISWIDWRLKEKNHEIYRFCRAVIAFRKRHPVFRRISFFDGSTSRLAGLRHLPDIKWFGYDGKEPDWNEDAHTLACLINGMSAMEISSDRDNDMFLMFNAGEKKCTFVIPKSPGGNVWTVALDTAKPPPDDIPEPGTEPILRGVSKYDVHSRSMVVLMSQ